MSAPVAPVIRISSLCTADTITAGGSAGKKEIAHSHLSIPLLPTLGPKRRLSPDAHIRSLDFNMPPTANQRTPQKPRRRPCLFRCAALLSLTSVLAALSALLYLHARLHEPYTPRGPFYFRYAYWLRSTAFVLGPYYVRCAPCQRLIRPEGHVCRRGLLQSVGLGDYR